MPSQKELLQKGITKTLMAILPMFIGPVILHSAFKNKLHPMYEVVIVLGVLVCGFSVFLFFKGIKYIVNALFQSPQ